MRLPAANDGEVLLVDDRTYVLVKQWGARTLEAVNLLAEKFPPLRGQHKGVRLSRGEEVSAFIPFPLPPRDPPLNLDGDLAPLLARKKNRTRVFKEYLDHLREGTDVAV